jgi:hypothetical protein
MDTLDCGSWNGWTFWRVKRSGELLSELRDQYLKDHGETA